RLNIVVANGNGNDVSVLLGVGNGSFENQISYSAGSFPQSVVVGDFNNDTRLDIVVANGNGNDVSILLQYNRGAIAYKMAYASGGGSSVQSVVIGDLNNDTNLDIVLANYGTNNIGVIFGYGNGSFENQMMLSAGANSQPISIAVGDFNGDCVLDIALANNGTKHADMMLGNGKGKFAIQTSFEIGFDSPPLVMASGDFNNDKQSEIVIANGGSNHLDIFVAYNHGTFEDQKRYSVGSYPRSVVVGDFNNDSRLDIVVANEVSNDVSVLLGNGNGSFENQRKYPAGMGPQSVVVGDFNNDSRLDIVVVNWGSHD
ncbi:unnamed protein product, partial [Rotaria sp. Silwood2]